MQNQAVIDIETYVSMRNKLETLEADNKELKKNNEDLVAAVVVLAEPAMFANSSMAPRYRLRTQGDAIVIGIEFGAGTSFRFKQVIVERNK